MATTPPQNDEVYESLTQREIEILSCLKDGLSNREIAGQLHLALKTVKWYNTQIYAKLNVKNRKQAVTRAQSLGILYDDASSTPNNLQIQATPFIGREQEINDLSALLDNDHIRLITILAAGGMGKTRLALEIAQQQLATFQDGVYFVSLTALDSYTQIVSTIIAVLGLQHESKDRLLDYLRDKQLLLVLDNFEHLIEGAGLITEVLQEAVGIKVLVTSREKLGLSGETVYSVDGMNRANWSSLDDALQYDAVQLFLQSTQVARSDFQLEPDDVPYLARICQLTEGMPLAIVLAATWIDVLSLAEIADEIQQNLNFLTAKMRDVPRRQWSMRAVFDPTWKRLTDDEQSVFMKFAVFRGGCTREAAEAVTGATLRHLQSFANKALLSRTADGRYQIHELLRQYAEYQLQGSGQDNSVQDTHSSYYLNKVAESEDTIWTINQQKALGDLQIDIENIRVAWKWAYNQQMYQAIHQAIYSLYWVYWLNSRFEEGALLFKDAAHALSVDNPDEQQQVVLALLRAYEAVCYVWGYQEGEYLPQLMENVDRLRHLKAHIDMRLPLIYILMFGGFADAKEATAAGNEIIRISEEQDQPLLMAGAIANLGESVYLRFEQIDKAQQYLLDALARYEDMNSPMGIAWVSGLLARIALRDKNYELASQYYTTVVEGWRLLGGKWATVGGLASLAFTAQALGRHDKAKQYYHESTEILKTLGIANKYVEEQINNGMQHWQQIRHDDARRSLEQGLGVARALSNPQLIADSLNKLGHVATSLGELSQAKTHYLEALQWVKEAELPTWIFLEAVTGLANLKYHSGHIAIANKWLSLTFYHPNNTTEGRELVTQFLALLQSPPLPDDNFLMIEDKTPIDWISVTEELLAD